MAKELSTGDRVGWNTPQGRTRGTVQQKKTTDFEFAGQHFAASEDEPAFIVKSQKSGDEAAHKGSALRRLKS